MGQHDEHTYECRPDNCDISGEEYRVLQREKQLLDKARESGMTEDQLAKVTATFRFAREHGLRCSGSRLRNPCGSTPCTILILHGRPIAVQCPECSVVTGAEIIYMGHGSYREDRLETHGRDELELGALMKWSRVLADRPAALRIGRGRWWGPALEEQGRAKLEQYLAEVRES